MYLFSVVVALIKLMFVCIPDKDKSFFPTFLSVRLQKKKKEIFKNFFFFCSFYLKINIYLHLYLFCENFNKNFKILDSAFLYVNVFFFFFILYSFCESTRMQYVICTYLRTYVDALYLCLLSQRWLHTKKAREREEEK